MPKKLIVTKGWTFMRPDYTWFRLWQHESYKVISGTWKGTVGSLSDIIEDNTAVAVRLSVPGGYIVEDPENLSECN